MYHFKYTLRDLLTVKHTFIFCGSLLSCFWLFWTLSKVQFWPFRQFSSPGFSFFGHLEPLKNAFLPFKVISGSYKLAFKAFWSFSKLKFWLFQLLARQRWPPAAFFLKWGYNKRCQWYQNLPLDIPKLHAKFHQNPWCGFGEKCGQDNDIV